MAEGPWSGPRHVQKVPSLKTTTLGARFQLRDLERHKTFRPQQAATSQLLLLEAFQDCTSLEPPPTRKGLDSAFTSLPRPGFPGLVAGVGVESGRGFIHSSSHADALAGPSSVLGFLSHTQDPRLSDIHRRPL